MTKDLDAYGEGMPLDIRVRMGLLRLRLADADEAMRHFDQIYVQRGDIADLYDLFYTIGDELRQHELWEPAVRFYEPIKEVEDELADIAGQDLRDIVDTVPFSVEGRKLTGEGILKVVLGAVNRRLDRKKSKELHRQS